MSEGREDFSTAVKGTIAGRAGYRCSFPECDKSTIGPGAASGQTASVGVACHIYSAAPSGPRGQGGLSREHLTSAENGFWACETHAKLVDTNEGRRYPAGLLLGWRELHEARIHREMGGIDLPVYWIEKLEVVRSPVRRQQGPLFAAHEALNLSKVTLLIGPNGSGKTAICEWLRAASDEQALWRWKRADVALSMTIHNPQRHVFSTEVVNDGILLRLDGEVVPFNPLPVVIRSMEVRERRLDRERSDVEWMADNLDVSNDVLRRLIRGVQANGTPFLEEIDVSDDGEIRIRSLGHEHWDVLSQAGGSGNLFATIALAARQASNSAMHAPTLMIIDGIWAFDAANKALVLGELAKLKGVQTLATLPVVDKRLEWGGWSVATIDDGPNGGTIRDG